MKELVWISGMNDRFNMVKQLFSKKTISVYPIYGEEEAIFL